jgi:hypothetical protein
MDLLDILLEKDLFSEYKVIIEDISTLDKIPFFKKYIEINEKFDGEDNFIWYDSYSIDLSGEYLHIIKEDISQWLEIYGIKNFSWKKNSNKDTDIDGEENINKIFRKINKELEAIKYKIIFIDRRDDGYCYYFIISNENIDKIDFNDDLFEKVKEFCDIKEYGLYLLTKTMNIKLKGYLKDNFNLKLNEINDFIKSEKILINSGSKSEIENDKNEIKKLGGEIEIIEI